MKDKIKKPKPIDDYSKIFDNPNLEKTYQCPNCLQLFIKDHKCNEVWLHCTICGLDMHKPMKKDKMGFTSFRFKKFYRLVNSVICHNCACNVVRMVNERK